MKEEKQVDFFFLIRMEENNLMNDKKAFLFILCNVIFNVREYCPETRNRKTYQKLGDE